MTPASKKTVPKTVSKKAWAEAAVLKLDAKTIKALKYFFLLVIILLFLVLAIIIVKGRALA